MAIGEIYVNADLVQEVFHLPTTERASDRGPPLPFTREAGRTRENDRQFAPCPIP
jgi:hypothetical protein